MSIVFVEVTQAAMHPALLHLLRTALHSVHDAVVTTDTEARVQTLNLAAEAITGWLQSEAVGKPIDQILELRESVTDNLLPNPIYTALSQSAKQSLPGQPLPVVLLIGRGGRRTAVEATTTQLTDSEGTSIGAAIILYNIGEAQQLAERFAYEAHYDPLTGLPNRILLVDRMEQATRLADRLSDQLAVLSIAVVPSAAHAFPEEFPRQAAVRLTNHLRESDTVCRLSGSEFVVLLSGVRQLGDVETLTAKLVTELSRPYILNENGLPVTLKATCSIGISLYPQHASDAGTLIRLADGAMLQSKKSGPNQILFAGLTPKDQPIPVSC